MPIKLVTKRLPDHLRFELTGRRVLGEFATEMTRIWPEVARECEASGLKRVLGVSYLTGPARVADIYESAIAGCETLLRSHCERVAFAVLGGGASLEENRFGETIAASRGLDVRMFADEKAALAWLLDAAESAPRPPG